MTNIKQKIILLCIACSSIGSALAQIKVDNVDRRHKAWRALEKAEEEFQRNKEQQAFESFKADKQKEFEEFRRRRNAEFAEFMRQKWPEMSSNPAHKQVDQPEPEIPEVPLPVPDEPVEEKPDNEVPGKAVSEPEPTPLPISEPEPIPEPIAKPEPVKPVVEQKMPFTFYGTPCSVSLSAKHNFRLKGSDENSVADAWLELSSDKYLPIIGQCEQLKEELQLCDWACFKLLEAMTTTFFSAGEENKARLMQIYLMTQLGYKVRIARSGNRLVMLLPSDDEIYGYSYVKEDGLNYYILDTSMKGSLHVFRRAFPEERFLSLKMETHPKLSEKYSEKREFVAEAYPETKAEVRVNKNLMYFYTDYPKTNDVNVYAEASLTEEVKEQLYPSLKKALAGKTQTEAADILLNFVQTAFEYKTDGQQFGMERPLFPDESFYYSFNDCEDRAILYSVLVYDLLGLDAVLIRYPQHVATAVCFENAVGDYLNIEGKAYTVCDPTYIRANIGMTMPQFKNSKVEILKIRR